MTTGIEILEDRTGCSHVPVLWFDVWICTQCHRTMIVWDDLEGVVLQAQESKLPPEEWPVPCLWCNGSTIEFDGSWCRDCS